MYHSEVLTLLAQISLDLNDHLASCQKLKIICDSLAIRYFNYMRLESLNTYFLAMKIVLKYTFCSEGMQILKRDSKKALGI